MEKLLILDYGSQYTHLISNNFRNIGIFTEIIPAFLANDEEKLKKISKEVAENQIKGIILSGGPQSVYEKDSEKINHKFFKFNLPILGICYGHQLICDNFGGKVVSGEKKEYGNSQIKINKNSKIFKGIKDDEIKVWMSHGDEIESIGKGFKIIGSTEDCKNGALENEDKKIYTLQFHPEVSHSLFGEKILENFGEICGIKKEWNLEKFLDLEKKDILNKVGDKKVFLFISGGVDSTVVYFLLKKIIGAENIFPHYVNTGFMRKDETSKVKYFLENSGVQNLNIINASETFFTNLKEKYLPEEKRKIIGNLFIEIQEKALKNFNSENFLLGQGTIYPDTIESGATKHSKTIKTHHNRVEKIQKMIEKGLVIEPISSLYKDEVRNLGKKLKVPKEMIERHPFPGPGLAVRILCSEKAEEKDFKKEEKDFEDILKGKFFPQILQIKSVGVQGDNRTYNHPLLLNGKFSSWDNLEKLSTFFTNNFSFINRVLFNLGEKKKSYKVLEKVFLTEKRVKLLQEIDEIVNNFLIENNLLKKIWQFPVVLAPLSCDGKKESIILRPINSKEAMTANFYHFDFKLLKILTEKILKNSDIGDVFYDITNKPPGTIEWE